MYYLTHLFILNACELGIVILILQVMKRGRREAERPAQCH